MSSPIVYEHPLSPYAQKVKLALLEKGVAFEVAQPAGLGAEEVTEFLAISPRSEVPVLVDGAITVFDSSVILQYIEDRWPEPSLLPPEPAQRARMRMIEEAMDTHFEANTWGLSEIRHFGRADGELAERLQDYGRQEISAWYTWLNQQLGDQAWFNGSTFGWGDLCVIPFVNGAARFDLLPETGTPLSDWLRRANERPSVQQCKVAADGAELDPAIMQAALKAGFKREYRDHRLEWMVKAGGITVVEKGLAAQNIRFISPFAS